LPKVSLQRKKNNFEMLIANFTFCIELFKNNHLIPQKTLKSLKR